MKVLHDVTPTSEQLKVIIEPSPGFWLIRGAAGSGKTTTAILRLKYLTRFWRERRDDLGLGSPVRVLVLTFNRTLRGYINELAEQQVQAGTDLELTVSTFGHWAIDLVKTQVLADDVRGRQIGRLASSITLDRRFVIDEVDYVLGRLLPEDLNSYLVIRRDGRGQAPRMERLMRERLLNEVILPYQQWKSLNGLMDWNDLAVQLVRKVLTVPYHVVIVDETQDFSANQVRAIANHVSSDATEHSTTFIRDTVQRIYPCAFTWREVGIAIAQQQNVHLSKNHRNTKQIATFVRPLVEGVEAAEEDELPDFRDCTRDGPLPKVLFGRYSKQVEYALEWFRKLPEEDTVAFLHPLGWFRHLRKTLVQEGIPHISITRSNEWPKGPERVALSTMHSAKGLEFDHVVVLGLNAEVVHHGEDEHDAQLENHRRLLAMALGRARQSVILGYKPEDAPALVRYLRSETYEEIPL